MILLNKTAFICVPAYGHHCLFIFLPLTLVAHEQLGFYTLLGVCTLSFCLSRLRSDVQAAVFRLNTTRGDCVLLPVAVMKGATVPDYDSSRPRQQGTDPAASSE